MNRAFDLERLRNALFARSKLLWGIGLTVNLIVFIFGTAIIFIPLPGTAEALIGLTLAVVAEFLMWLSERWKGAASELHRKLDLENSFGWNISDQEMKNFLARYAGDIVNFAGKEKGNYFASNHPPGPLRAVENLEESAWWSMHLSETMGWISTGVIVLTIIGCIFLLNISLHDVSEATKQVGSALVANTSSDENSKAVSAGIVKAVTSIMLFVFSYGLFKLACGYFLFSKKAEQLAEKAESIQKGGTPDQIEVIKMWQEYHLARESAPIIPNWVWKIREEKLNLLWKA